MSDEQLKIEQILESEGILIKTNSGTSMMPLLRQGRDLMVIKKKGSDRCKKYDAVLYKSAGRYVLHRIIKVRQSDYVIVGDNCRRLEYGITDDDILGILTAVLRGGKRELKSDSPLMKVYVHLWCDLFPVRAFIILMREKAIGLAKLIIKRRK